MMPWAANCTACCEEPHWRSMVVAGTSSGSPAASQALRATLTACSPIWETQPMITSSTRPGSIPLRSTRARSAAAPRSTACRPARPPLRRPTGVRTAPTMTGSRSGACMAVPLPLCRLPRRWHRTRGAVNHRRPPGSVLLLDDHPVQAELLQRPVAGVAVAGGDRVHHLHALDHLAEDGVLAVQPGRRHLGDEELRAVGVGPGVGHRQVAGPVEAARPADLVLEGVAGTAAAGAERVAALDH